MTILKYKINRNILFFFIFAIILGFILGLKSEQEIVDVAAIHSINYWDMFRSIIINNTIAFLLLSCSFLIGKPIIYMFFGINGFFIGTVIGKVRTTAAIVLLAPHGLIEMWAYLFIGTFLYNILIKENRDALLSDKKKYIQPFILAYSILIIAVFIEVFITPKLVVWFLI